MRIKKLVFLLVACLFPTVAVQAATFTEKEVDVSIQAPRASQIVDFDNDGDQDIVVAASNSFAIYWFENLGNAFFARRTVYAGVSPFTPDALYVCDLDGDGDQDVIVASNPPMAANDRVFWYENDGHQNFTQHQLATYAWPASVYAGDIDNDGDLDIAVASHDYGNIYWLRNNGGGSFTSAPIDPTFTRLLNVLGVVIVDLDKDGYTDICSAANGTLAFWKNNGSQVFTEHIIASGWGTGIRVADMNNDGNLDIISAAAGTTDNVSWWEYDGNTTFAQRSVENVEASVPVPIDVDHDGDMDLVGQVGSFPTTHMVWWERTGAYSFIRHNISVNYHSAGPDAVGDLNGDGDIDLVDLHPDDNLFAWWENNGSQQFTMHPLTGSGDVQALVVADMNQDSNQDIVSIARYTGDIYWWKNLEFGNRFEAQVIDETFLYGKDVKAADVDQDGDLDIIAGTADGGTSLDQLAWWENNGSQKFTKHVISNALDEIYAVGVADIDGDGKMDILAAAPGNNTISWWRNNGSQVFTGNYISIAYDGYDIKAADLDGDGDLDPVTAGNSNADVSWWENDGSENFTRHIVDPVLSGARTVEILDINGDSHLDILAGGQYASTVAWYESDGNTTPTFTRHNIDSAFAGPEKVAAMDIDHDNDIDVAAVNGASPGLVTWWENDGLQNFTRHDLNTTFINPHAVAFGDMDQDNDADIVAGGGTSGGRILWWQQTGIGPTPTTTPTPSITITATITATPTNTCTPTITRTPTPTPSVTRTASPTPTPSRTPSPTRTGTATPTASPTLTETKTATNSPTWTVTWTATDTPTATPTFSATPTPSATPTATASATITDTFTASPTFTQSPTPASSTSTCSATATPLSTATSVESPTAILTVTASATPTSTPTHIQISDRFRNKDVIAYPMPASEVVNFWITNTLAGEVKISIYNIAGEKIADIRHEAFDSGTLELAWQCREAAAGCYFARVQRPCQPVMMVKIILVR